MNDNLKRIKQIDIENFIWIIYFFIIGLCLYGNKLEKNYFLTGNNIDKSNYRKINIIIFVIAVIIYLYFFIDSYQEVNNLNSYDSNEKKTYNELSLLGSTLVLISGIIFLYILIVDDEIETEIAFN